MNITLTISGGTAAEVQQAVKELSSTFGVSESGEIVKNKAVATKKEQPVKSADLVNEKQPEAAPVVNSENIQTNTSSGIAVEEVRAAAIAAAKKAKENRGKVKELLSTYGAENIDLLATEHYGDFLTKVKEL